MLGRAVSCMRSSTPTQWRKNGSWASNTSNQEMKSLRSLCWASRLVWEYLSLFQSHCVLLCFAHVHVPLALRHASSFLYFRPHEVLPLEYAVECVAQSTVLAEDWICWPWGAATAQDVGLRALCLLSAGSKRYNTAAWCACVACSPRP